MKRGKRDFKLSNRWLYTFIILGIFAVVGVGVYAYGTSSPSTFGHSVGEIDLNGVSRVITAEVVGLGASQSIYDIAANHIAAQTSIYSYGKICVGNSAGDCSGTGGTVITSNDISANLFFTNNIHSPIMRLGGGRLYTIADASDPNYYIQAGAWNTGLEFHQYEGGFRFFTNAGEIASISSGGAIYSAGGVTAPSFIYSSDESLKANVTLLNNALEKVKQLEGVSFNWKNTGRADIGLIAQDVEKVIPEIVHTNEEGLKSVEYGNLVAILIEAVKEQQEEIDSQYKEINFLNEKLDKICSKLPSLCE
jgi:hypothetical protein